MPARIPIPAPALAPFLALMLAGFSPAPDNAVQDPPMSPHAPSVKRISYQRWPDSLLLSNGRVEAVVVPAIGRVMQLRFAGESDGPFWENPMLASGNAAPDPGDWANYGGDKTWPAPQSDWERIAGRAWPPPAGFDSRPMEATIDGPGAVTLVSQVDASFGIRVRRCIALSPDHPVMTATTTYEKVGGAPVAAAVWVITQLKNPVAVYAFLSDPPLPGAGFVRQSEDLPANFMRGAGLLSLTRDRHKSHKIGTLAGSLLWIGPREMVRIDSSLIPGGKYPDGGTSAQVYTNADPLPYVELELLGPLARLTAGDSITRVSSYTLLRRMTSDPESEAKSLMANRPGPP